MNLTPTNTSALIYSAPKLCTPLVRGSGLSIPGSVSLCVASADFSVNQDYSILDFKVRLINLERLLETHQYREPKLGLHKFVKP